MFCQIEINALFAIAFSFFSTEDRSSQFKTDSSQSIYSRSFQCIIHARLAFVYTKENVAKWTSLVPVNAPWIEQTKASFYFQNFQIFYCFVFFFLKRQLGFLRGKQVMPVISVLCLSLQLSDNLMNADTETKEKKHFRLSGKILNFQKPQRTLLQKT